MLTRRCRPCEMWWQVLGEYGWLWDKICSRRTARRRTAGTQHGSPCPVHRQLYTL